MHPNGTVHSTDTRTQNHLREIANRGRRSSRMRPRIGIATPSVSHGWGILNMDAMALARALNSSRRIDGAISLRELQARLARAGLEEFVWAVGFLAERLTLAKRETATEIVPWFQPLAEPTARSGG